MLYYLSLLTHTDQLAFFRLFRYLTFRSGARGGDGADVAFMFNPILIRWLKVKQGKASPSAADGPAAPYHRKGRHPHHGRAADPDPLDRRHACCGPTCPTCMSGSRCW